MNAVLKGALGQVAVGRRRDPAIETLRGVAILMVVGFHVVSHPLFGPKTGYPLFRHLSFSLDGLRMPLFTVISGMVYAMKPVREALGRFVRGKARRILIPLVTISTVEYLLRTGLPGVASQGAGGPIWEIYLFGYQHFWFLQAVFLIFLLVGFLDSRGWLSRPEPYLGVLAVAMVVNVLAPRPAFFSIGASFYLLPHFLVGLGIMRFGERLSRRPVTLAALVVLAVSMVVHQLTWFGVVTLNVPEQQLIWLTTGVSGTTLLVRMRWVARPLIWIGGYAYVIYLFHGITMAPGNRLALALFGDTALAAPALFVLAMFTGVALPILVARTLGGLDWFRRFVLGLRARPAPAARHARPSAPRPAVATPARAARR